MKKQLYIVAAIVALASVSCRKERTCECKTELTSVRTGNNPSTTSTTTTDKVTKEKQKKKEFRQASDCFSKKYSTTNDYNLGINTYTVVNSYNVTCELK